MTIDEIRAKKKALKLTTADIAYYTELPVSTVSKIMTGETKNPSYATIEKISRFIENEEFKARVDAYFKVLKKYMAEHPDEEVNQYEFFYKYAEEHPFHEERPEKDYDFPFVRNLALADMKGFTIEDIQNLGETRNVELIDGCVIYNDLPKTNHQILVQNMGRKIDKYIDSNQGACMMFNVGVSVRFINNDHDYLIPDIVVVCDKDKIDSDGIYGAPDWVIEVSSPGTKPRDNGVKLQKYMSYGVREYWIVDQEKRRVTVYLGEEPEMLHIYGFDDEIPVHIYDGKLKIRISDL